MLTESVGKVQLRKINFVNDIQGARKSKPLPTYQK